jgi:hypothetical protein
MNLNLVNCLIDSNNTGFGRCVPRPGKLEYEILVPKGYVLTETDADTIQAILEALLIDDSNLDRGYVIGKFVKVDDSSADDVRESFDQGVEQTLYDGAYIWTRRILQGGFCAQKALRNLNGAQDQFDSLLCFRSTDNSAKFYIAGRRQWNSTTNKYDLRAMSYDDMFAPKWTPAQGNTSAQFRFRTVMGDVTQLNEDMVFIPVSFDIADLPRVKDVSLTLTKVSTGVFAIDARESCSGQNLIELYPGIFDAAGAWIITNDLGNVVTVTGVTETNGQYRATLDTGTPDPDYTAGTQFRAHMAAISVTKAAPYSVEYIESGYSNYAAK